MGGLLKMVVVAALAVASTVWVAGFFEDVDEQAIAFTGPGSQEQDDYPFLDPEQSEDLERYLESARILYDHQSEKVYESHQKEIDAVTQLMAAKTLEMKDRIHRFDPSPDEVIEMVEKAKKAGVDAVQSDEFERYITGEWLRDMGGENE